MTTPLARLEGSFGVVTLRRAGAGDVETIVGLLDAMAISRGRADGDQERFLQAYRRISSNPEELLLVAVDEQGEILATLQYTLLPGLSYGALLRAQLEGFAVREDQRGNGLGAAIIGWVKERASADGVGVLQLTSNLARDRAIGFYERLGFEHSHAGLKLMLPSQGA